MPDSNSFTRSQPWVKNVRSSSRAAATESTLMCNAFVSTKIICVFQRANYNRAQLRGLTPWS